MAQDYLVGNEPVAIVFERSPAGKAQPPLGTSRAQEIGERCGRIGEKHDAKARRDQVETAALELMGLRGCLDQRDIAEPGFGEALARLRQHRG